MQTILNFLSETSAIQLNNNIMKDFDTIEI